MTDVTTTKPKTDNPPATDNPTDPDAPELKAFLVLANGKTVRVENGNSTEHYDDELGVNVPVVSSFTVA